MDRISSSPSITLIGQVRIGEKAKIIKAKFLNDDYFYVKVLNGKHELQILIYQMADLMHHATVNPFDESSIINKFYHSKLTLYQKNKSKCIVSLKVQEPHQKEAEEEDQQPEEEQEIKEKLEQRMDYSKSFSEQSFSRIFANNDDIFYIIDPEEKIGIMFGADKLHCFDILEVFSIARIEQVFDRFLIIDRRNEFYFLSIDEDGEPDLQPLEIRLKDEEIDPSELRVSVYNEEGQDHAYIYYLYKNKIYQVDLLTLEEKEFFDLKPYSLKAGFGWNVEGSTLYFTSQWTLHVFDPRIGHSSVQIPSKAGATEYSWVYILPAGRMVFVIGIGGHYGDMYGYWVPIDIDFNEEKGKMYLSSGEIKYTWMNTEEEFKESLLAKDSSLLLQENPRSIAFMSSFFTVNVRKNYRAYRSLYKSSKQPTKRTNVKEFVDVRPALREQIKEKIKEIKEKEEDLVETYIPDYKIEKIPDNWLQAYQDAKAERNFLNKKEIQQVVQAKRNEKSL